MEILYPLLEFSNVQGNFFVVCEPSRNFFLICTYNNGTWYIPTDTILYIAFSIYYTAVNKTDPTTLVCLELPSANALPLRVAIVHTCGHQWRECVVCVCVCVGSCLATNVSIGNLPTTRRGGSS